MFAGHTLTFLQKRSRIIHSKSGKIVHTYNPGTQETEEKAQAFKTSLSDMVRPCLKRIKKKERKKKKRNPQVFKFSDTSEIECFCLPWNLFTP
jgi:hypothetical protein